MAFLDLFSEQSDLYAASRPSYPPELFRFIASIAGAHDCVWDCATGNGQAAVGLAGYFKQVEATDASEQQIRHAFPCDGIRYSVQAAESTVFANSSFDAVCVAQALHWFDFARFYPEVHRVLKPSGVFVAWGYHWFNVSPEFDAQFAQCIFDVIEADWAPQNQLVWNGYRDAPFPFERLAAPKVDLQLFWTFEQLLAFVNSWSAVRRHMKDQGPEFLERAVALLTPLWGDPHSVRLIHMPLSLLAGRHV